MSSAHNSLLPRTGTPRQTRSLSIAIVGAGIGGIGMGIRLQQTGHHNFTIFEKADRPGGVWRDNTYPDAGCDVPSHLYSFSFERRATWTRRFPKQPEILSYLEDCIARHNLAPKIRCNVEITQAIWRDNIAKWELTSQAGDQHHFDVVIWGLGQLNRPKWPSIEGMDEFAGTIFHSARWNHEHDLTGDRIAVIGNGASAVQFVPPVAAKAATLYQFQHSPNWFLPKPDAPFTDEQIRRFQRIPGWDQIYRTRLYASFESKWGALRQGSKIAGVARDLSTKHITKHVPDPELRAKLLPDFPVGCKRILISDNYLDALSKDNVEVVTDPIARIEPDAIMTNDGTRRPVDTIIVATGFQTTDFLAPVTIVGRAEHRLADDWSQGARAYQGIAVPNYPNMFILYGPNTNLNHNSIIFMLEAQYRWILGALKLLANGNASIEVKPAVARRYDERIQRALGKTAFSADCHSWYKTESGRITNNWPGPTIRYWFDTHWVRRSDLFIRPNLI